MRSFLFSFMFFTRLPVKIKGDHSEDAAAKAIRFLPLIGIIVGCFSALIYCGSTFIFPYSVSILLSMIASIFITGAFHEDGLADVCDGFGGGRTRERKLEIMKDSHIGVFGVAALIMILILKFVLLFELNSDILPFIIISAHSLSRLSPVIIMRTHEYARNNGQSKIIQLVKKISVIDIVIAALFGIVPLLLFQNLFYFLLIIPVLFTQWILGIYFKKQIGGYTGDCLGAAQQICEIVIYLSIFILWKYI
jgi:adenosylcobinamide-GDP ribazoletransferase